MAIIQSNPRLTETDSPDRGSESSEAKAKATMVPSADASQIRTDSSTSSSETPSENDVTTTKGTKATDLGNRATKNSKSMTVREGENKHSQMSPSRSPVKAKPHTAEKASSPVSQSEVKKSNEADALRSSVDPPPKVPPKKSPQPDKKPQSSAAPQKVPQDNPTKENMQKSKNGREGNPPKPQDPTYAPAREARAKKRHWLLLWSFVLCVLLPSGLTGIYLWERAVDQYKSSLGFTVRQEEAPSAVDILGGLTNLSSSSSSDSDILYEFIQSQELVEKINKRIDLRSIYSRHHKQDPLFSLKPDSAIEDLLTYWQRMVQISYAPGTGLIELKVLAFTPEEARAIAQLIVQESSQMINTLSAIAREDAMRYAREDLDQAVEQLKSARQAMTTFRSRTQIVDPSADIQLQMGLLTILQQQLGDELINYDLLLANSQANDPRLQQSQQRISALRARISQERKKFGGAAATADGVDYATLVAEFERLTVDREFAEQKYAGALKNFDSARAEAQRQSRYLAAYLNPTLAQSAEYPRRILIFALTCLFLLIAWSTLALIYYSLRDRK